MHPATGKKVPPWDYFRPGRASLSLPATGSRQSRTLGMPRRPRRTIWTSPPGRLLSFREFAKLLMAIAQFPTLTSKGSRMLCQAQSALLMRFLAPKQHISAWAPPAAAILGIQIPIGSLKILARGVAQSLGRPINRSRGALHLEKGACGRFVEIQMQPRQKKGGSELFIAKPRNQADPPKNPSPSPRKSDCRLPLHLFLIGRRGRSRNRRLRRDHGAFCPRPYRTGRGGNFHPKPQEPPEAAEIGIWSIVERVAFEDPSARPGAHSPQAAQQGGQIADSQLDFNFSERSAARGHAPV